MAVLLKTRGVCSFIPGKASYIQKSVKLASYDRATSKTY